MKAINAFSILMHGRKKGGKNVHNPSRADGICQKQKALLKKRRATAGVKRDCQCRPAATTLFSSLVLKKLKLEGFFISRTEKPRNENKRPNKQSRETHPNLSVT